MGPTLVLDDTDAEVFNLFVDWLYGYVDLRYVEDETQSPVLRLQATCDPRSPFPKTLAFSSYLIRLYLFAKQWRVRFLGDQVIRS